MTIKELELLCKKEINKGNGNKTVFISGDEEGNSYSELLYGFETSESLIEEYKGYEDIMPLGVKPKTMLLG